RNLAKVEVGSSRLLSRSSFFRDQPIKCRGCSGSRHTAGWQSGHAAACKAVDAGSIPTPASILLLHLARVVKLVDTRDLKSLGRKAVQVQVLPRAPSLRRRER